MKLWACVPSIIVKASSYENPNERLKGDIVSPKRDEHIDIIHIESFTAEFIFIHKKYMPKMHHFINHAPFCIEEFIRILYHLTSKTFSDYIQLVCIMYSTL